MIRLTLALATACMLATPVAAQRKIDPDRVDKSQIGSRFKMTEEAVDRGDMRKIQKKMMRCTASGDWDLARELLTKSDPANTDYEALSVDYETMLDKMNFDRCMIRAIPQRASMMSLRMNPATMRSAFAEEVYLQDNDEAPVIREGDPEYLDNRFYVSGEPYIMAEVPARLADCIVYRAPVKAHEFLDANPTSKGEREAAEALGPTVSECLPGDDAEVSFPISQLRAYVADGLWARTHYGATARQNKSDEVEGTE